MSPAGSEVRPCLLPKGSEATPDALSPCKVLRGEDGKGMALGASVSTCLGSLSDNSSQPTLQFVGGDPRG